MFTAHNHWSTFFYYEINSLSVESCIFRCETSDVHNGTMNNDCTAAYAIGGHVLSYVVLLFFVTIGNRMGQSDPPKQWDEQQY